MSITTAKKEIRIAELRAVTTETEGRIVDGYSVRFNSPAVFSIGGVEYREIISPGALDNADMSDVPFKYNHSDGIMIMARTRNKTLTLTRDDKGLFIRAELADTTAGRDLYTLIKRGDIDKMSFAFTVDTEAKDGDVYDRKTRTRTINRIKKLYDVSAVDLPAYESTSISARSFFELESDKELKALERAELHKRALSTKIMIVKTIFEKKG